MLVVDLRFALGLKYILRDEIVRLGSPYWVYCLHSLDLFTRLNEIDYETHTELVVCIIS